jgi:hypothetical protein
MEGEKTMNVPKNVWEGLEAVRVSGQTNMLVISDVVRCAQMLGYQETAQWIQDHRNEYREGVFQGFVASP